ncbi:MAG: class I SAM-dependent methyltransferase [Flavobacteriaceae bacterium]
MTNEERKNHWEHIYHSKTFEACSWYQDIPEFSLNQIKKYAAIKTPIIDVGGGESKLTEKLFQQGFQDLTVLDISQKAIEKAQKRMRGNVSKVQWILSDITTFQTDKNYGLWHDRAAFHFLTQQNDIATYIDIASERIVIGGYLVIGTFSKTGPNRCSGIDVKQYDAPSLARCFKKSFTLVHHQEMLHTTPFDTQQAFCFCILQRN